MTAPNNTVCTVQKSVQYHKLLFQVQLEKSATSHTGWQAARVMDPGRYKVLGQLPECDSRKRWAVEQMEL